MVIFLYFEFFHLYILWVFFFFFFFLLHAFPNFIPILKYFEIDSINVYFSFNLASFSVLVIFQLVILVHQLQQISVSWHSNISNFHLISFHLIFRIYFISALLPINKNVFFNSFSFSSQLHTLCILQSIEQAMLRLWVHFRKCMNWSNVYLECNASLFKVFQELWEDTS